MMRRMRQGVKQNENFHIFSFSFFLPFIFIAFWRKNTLLKCAIFQHWFVAIVIGEMSIRYQHSFSLFHCKSLFVCVTQFIQWKYMNHFLLFFSFLIFFLFFTTFLFFLRTDPLVDSHSQDFNLEMTLNSVQCFFFFILLQFKVPLPFRTVFFLFFFIFFSPKTFSYFDRCFKFEVCARFTLYCLTSHFDCTLKSKERKEKKSFAIFLIFFLLLLSLFSFLDKMTMTNSILNAPHSDAQTSINFQVGWK